jgi:hypothetical protein
MERFLSTVLDEVLVGANTGGLESLGAQLFILVGDEVNAEGEVIDVRLLSAEIEDSNLGVRDTTVESGLGIRLVLAVSVATGGTTSHLDGFSRVCPLVWCCCLVEDEPVKKISAHPLRA